MTDSVGTVTTPNTGSVTEGAGSVTAFGDGVNPSLRASVVQSHLADAQPLGATVQAVQTNDVCTLFNGATFDRQRGNVDFPAILTLTAATAATSGAAQTNFNGRGAQIGINTTVISGTSFTIAVQGQDVASGTWYTLLTSAAITATGFTLLTLYPGAPATANASSPQVLPRTFRVVFTPTSATVTATIGASVIV